MSEGKENPMNSMIKEKDKVKKRRRTTEETQSKRARLDVSSSSDYETCDSDSELDIDGIMIGDIGCRMTREKAQRLSNILAEGKPPKDIKDRFVYDSDIYTTGDDDDAERAKAECKKYSLSSGTNITLPLIPVNKLNLIRSDIVDLKSLAVVRQKLSLLTPHGQSSSDNNTELRHYTDVLRPQDLCKYKT